MSLVEENIRLRRERDALKAENLQLMGRYEHLMRVTDARAACEHERQAAAEAEEWKRRAAADLHRAHEDASYGHTLRSRIKEGRNVETGMRV